MTIVDQSARILLQLGASPILYLMIVLSIVSVAIMLERGWFFSTTKENLPRLAHALEQALSVGDLSAARQLARASRSVEAAVLAAGLTHCERGVEAAAEAMASASALGRLRLGRRLGFLGTLGSNAPFVGLLGTVIGIMQAFAELQHSGMGGSASSDIMGAIAEALVATAIGLAVAIPAVAGYNHFQQRIKVTLDNAEALEHVLLSYLKGVGATLGDRAKTTGASRSRRSLAGVSHGVSQRMES